MACAPNGALLRQVLNVIGVASCEASHLAAEPESADTEGLGAAEGALLIARMLRKRPEFSVYLDPAATLIVARVAARP